MDIYVPENQTATSAKKLPVMVTIHGGGYNAGDAGSNPGDAMTHQSNGGLIYISIQYRLGLFGFLASTKIAKNGTANAGLLDQRLAFEWIQNHISAFGGDPTKVAIWGGSAGGGSVIYHLIANSGQGAVPFRAAIGEYPWLQPMMNLTYQDSQFQSVLKNTSCSDLACLPAIPSAQLASVQQVVLFNNYPSPGYAYGSFGFAPVVDGSYIRDLPLSELKKGNFQKVPLITDQDLSESGPIAFANITTIAQETTVGQYLFPSAGPSFFSRLYELYPRADFNTTYDQQQQWFGDFVVKCPTYTLASAAVDHLSNSSQVFKLIFSAGSQDHAATLPFLTDTDINFSSAPNTTIARIMTSYWISFAVTLDPNPLRVADAPFWPSYAGGWNASVTGGGVGDVGLEVMEVWQGNFTVVRDVDASARCDFLVSNGIVLSS